MTEEYAVQMKGITKVYSDGTAANREVDLSIRRGEIHGIVGENGAGKTTLMKLLAGIERPTSGEIWINGEKSELSSPAAAIAKGIGMVHQHAMLVPGLTVAENVLLGRTPRRLGLFVDREKAGAVTEKYARQLNMSVDPNAKVRDLPVSVKQKVEILKALAQGARLLILDEPTGVLTPQETQQLFKALIDLKYRGYTIIFISHKLEEVMCVTDRVSILREGKCVGVYDTQTVSPEEISQLMVGRSLPGNLRKEPARPGAEVLRVRNLGYESEWGKKLLDQVSFSVRRGEILGVTGVEDSGQKELVDLLFGFVPPSCGRVTVRGESILGLSQRKLRERGVSLVPEDRMLYGVAGAASVEENLISDRVDQRRLNRGPMMDMRAIRKEVEQLTQDYRIRCAFGGQRAESLSGGNLQRVVVAREFSNEPCLVIAHQPTQGIDISAVEFIRKKLEALSRSGAAVLLVSSDIQEVLGLSDRLVVLHAGRIAAHFEDVGELDPARVSEYMLGLKRQGAEEIGRACCE